MAEALLGQAWLAAATPLPAIAGDFALGFCFALHLVIAEAGFRISIAAFACATAEIFPAFAFVSTEGNPSIATFSIAYPAARVAGAHGVATLGSQAVQVHRLQPHTHTPNVIMLAVPARIPDGAQLRYKDVWTNTKIKYGTKTKLTRQRVWVDGFETQVEGCSIMMHGRTAFLLSHLEGPVTR